MQRNQAANNMFMQGMDQAPNHTWRLDEGPQLLPVDNSHGPRTNEYSSDPGAMTDYATQ